MTTLLASVQRLVIKVGSSLLIDPDTSYVAQAWLKGLAEDIAALRKEGVEVVVVSSGAAAIGRQRLKMDEAHSRLDVRQAAAAAGQAALMHAYETAFVPHGVCVAQALLTISDTETRRRWLNARATLERLLELGALPIVNENDTVATDELRFGDNDRLAARVAQMISADGLVLLSDIDGLYEGDPRANPNAAHIAEVSKITPHIEAMASGPNAEVGAGTGGMVSKIAAAKIAVQAGVWTAVALGAQERPLTALADGARATWFLAGTTPSAARKSWIAGALNPKGALVIDDGAARALTHGKSLLAAGVTEVRGAFERGDAVEVLNAGGEAIARGLAGYDVDEARAIAGLRSDAIEGVLGYKRGPALVHADDLVVLAEALRDD